MLLSGPLDIKELGKRMGKCFVYTIFLYGATSWTLRKEEERRLRAFEMWTWRTIDRISWEDRVMNEME